ncbi:MAG: hypothetical protein AAF845_04500 [Bacteroidota bacterium]
MRFASLALVFALAACSSPMRGSAPPPEAADPVTPPPGDLSRSQADQLRGLGFPVLVPGDPGDFRLSVFEVNQSAVGASYRLDYQRPDGACFQISGATEGLGGPGYPLVSTDVRIEGVPGRPVVRVFEAADDPEATSAQVWGVGAVVSEFVSMDGMSVKFLSDTVGGCRPVSLAEGAALVAGLEMIPAGGTTSGPAMPASGTDDMEEPSAFGTFEPAPDITSDYNAASDPEVAAEALAERYDGESQEVLIEVIGETDTEAVVLLTALGLFDDSVRDERLRLTYALDDFGTWELVEAGRQIRCWPERGHQDWSPEPCI